MLVRLKYWGTSGRPKSVAAMCLFQIPKTAAGVGSEKLFKLHLHSTAEWSSAKLMGPLRPRWSIISRPAC